MAREPARFAYLAHFAMALVAGFGTQVLFSQEEDLSALSRALRWLALGVTAAVAIPALFGKPEINEWTSLSLLLLLGSVGLMAGIVWARLRARLGNPAG